MALVLFDDPFDWVRPSRILDQQFGMGLDSGDLQAPFIPREIRNLFRGPAGYYRPWRTTASQQDVGSTVSVSKEKFQASLDVQQFKPDEITVKVTGDDTITIEGKHEEKQDEHGYISRHFVRKYVLPKGHDMDKIESKLSSDGVLTITAPQKGSIEASQRTIPITQTGQPSKPEIENKETSETKQDKEEATEKK